MDEATKMLGATCDTFIKTLEECMKLTSANVIFDPPISSDTILPPNNANSTVRKVFTNILQHSDYKMISLKKIVQIYPLMIVIIVIY